MENLDALVDGYVTLLKDQVSTDYKIQHDDMAFKISKIEETFAKVGYSVREDEEDANKCLSAIKAAGSKAGRLPVMKQGVGLAKGIYNTFYDFYEKGRHAKVDHQCNNVLKKIKWAEDEVDSLNDIAAELENLADECDVQLSYGNGVFGVKLYNEHTGQAKADQTNLEKFYEKAENMGFVRKRNLLHLPGYQKMIKFMVEHSNGMRLSFLRNDTDRKFWIENLGQLKEATDRRLDVIKIKSGLEREHEELNEAGERLERGYAGLGTIINSDDFKRYVMENIGDLQKNLGDFRDILIGYMNSDGSLSNEEEKDTIFAINLLWGNDQYAILSKEQLEGKLPGKRTMANMLNAMPEMRSSLESACDQKGLIALKIDNSLTKKMSEEAMVLAKNYHNIVRVPVYGIGQLFDAGKDKGELKKTICRNVRMVGVYHELDRMSADFREGCSGLGLNGQLSDDKGLLRFINDLKEEFKDDKDGLTVDALEDRKRLDLGGYADGLSLLYRSKAFKFMDNYIKERKEKEEELKGAVDYFIQRFDELFSISAYNPSLGGIQNGANIERMIDRETLSEAKNKVVRAYGRHSFVHSIQTMRAEGIQNAAQTLLMTGLLYKAVEEITKSKGAAMFVGANFDDVFAGLVDGLESMTGTAVEHGKRLTHTAIGGIVGVAAALGVGIYLFQGGDMHIGSIVIPEIVKHGTTLGIVSAGGSLGTLAGNSLYYKSSYKLLQEEGRMLDYVTDENGSTLESQVKAIMGNVRTGWREETTRPFIHGMFYWGVPTQVGLAIAISALAYYTGNPDILHNPVSVAMVGFWESLAGFFGLVTARKTLANWTKGIGAENNGTTLERFAQAQIEDDAGGDNKHATGA